LGRRALIAALPLFLSACSFNPFAPRERPDLATPAAWRDGPTIAGAAPAKDWWRGFGSAELADLVEAARAANQDLAAAAQRIIQADALVRVAGAPLFPSLEATASAIGTDRSRFGTRRTYDAGLATRWEIDLWGKNRAARDAEGFRALADRFDRDALLLSIDAGVADTYVILLAARDRRRVAADNLAAAERVLALVAARVANGAASPLELAQQRTAVARERAFLPPLELAARQAEHALAVLLSRPPAAVATRTTALDQLTTPEVPAGLPSDLLLRRPDLARAEADLVAASADLVAARKALYPSIVLTGFGGAESDVLTSLLNGNWLGSLAAGITQPIFEGGRLRGRVTFAEARREELVATYRQTAFVAFAEVEDALAAASARGRELALQEQSVASARTAFALAEAQYREGAIDLLALLVSQRALFDAEDARLVARRERLRAAVALFRALGGGWSEARAT
jgi:NodT family efflux transporter outer membrane factor (OMF) lipoprotein